MINYQVKSYLILIWGTSVKKGGRVYFIWTDNSGERAVA